ncbi:MAG TPA: hypothetical protein VFK69_02085 [Candidatus Eisenbacteria bacterium]|nr:hypothetical protein [Candidatus Eisenbacteria bacterium]
MRSSTARNVALAILAIAAAYHLGTRSASASVGHPIAGVAIQGDRVYVVTEAGDIYYRSDFQVTSPTLLGNMWTGLPTVDFGSKGSK